MIKCDLSGERNTINSAMNLTIGIYFNLMKRACDRFLIDADDQTALVEAEDHMVRIKRYRHIRDKIKVKS